MSLTCIRHIRVWRDGEPVSREIPHDGLIEEIKDPATLVWVDLVDPTPADLRRLGSELGLSHGAIEDATAPLERPKVVRHAQHLFFQTYATTLDLPTADSPDGMVEADKVVAREGHDGRLRTSRISGFVLPQAVVTVRLGEDFDIDEVMRRWSEDYDLVTHGAGALMHGLLDTIVDGHFDTIQRLDDAIEALEDVLFDEVSTGREFAQAVYGLRKDLVQLRRVVLPMREVVNGLLRHRPTGVAELDLAYEDLYDHVLRAAEWTESLRDMVTSVFETNLSLQDARLNVVMKKLAGWAAIIAVPTAITGWFGQNVPYPGFSEVSGYWLSVVLIVVLSVGLYAVFKRRDWL
ncbi:magnesium transporter CorA family protein [Piscicoccus intestinalis]|uniref:magnesium transporter CorA family protein n=1 Tax=Piscicoccus intestinalis TaxID=746033 RepID=UPI0008395A89|nr:magnesium transporter CorA family protein [Piscicoccus intestinalis]